MANPSNVAASNDEDAKGRAHPSFHHISAQSYPRVALSRTPGHHDSLGNTSPLHSTSRPQETARFAGRRYLNEWTTLDEQDAMVHGHPSSAPLEWTCTFGFDCEVRDRLTPGVGVQTWFVPGRRLRCPSPNAIPEKHRQDIDYEVLLTPEGARVLEEMKATRSAYLAPRQMGEWRQSESEIYEAERGAALRNNENLRMKFHRTQQMDGLAEESTDLQMGTETRSRHDSSDPAL